MASYDFTNSWDTGTYIKDGDSYSFSTTGVYSDYNLAIDDAAYTSAYNSNGEFGYLAPGGYGGNHGSDLQASFGSSYGTGGVDLLNFVDFDYLDDGSSEWTAMNDILGDSNTVGGYATAIDAEGEGFISVKSNFNGYNTFLSSDAGYSLAEDKLFDLWHLDGLSDGDYVTAQIVGVDTTLTDANLSVWGEIDGFMTEGGPDMLSWPYLNHDAIAIDSFNMSGDHELGDFTYTMNIVTDWNDCSASDYESFDWGYMNYSGMSSTEFSDMDWGYIEYDEFTTSSYTEINWAYAEFNEFESYSYTSMDWGYVEYSEFTTTSYTSMDWGEVQYSEFTTTSYTSMDWGQVQFNEFDGGDYKATSWNQVQMSEFGSDDYKQLNWGKVQYKEVLKSNDNLSDVDWGQVETNEWGKDDLKVLTKKSTDKKLAKLDDAELDINVLKKGKDKSFKGDADDDVIAASGKLLKKKVKVSGGEGNDTFVLKKGKGSMVIKDYEDSVDEINFAYCGSKKKIKVKQKGDDALIYSGKDLLAKVEDTNKNVLKKKGFGLV